MPDALWDVFRNNRDLLKDLPAIGAGVVARLAQKRFGCELPIVVVRHTFGAYLNFNAHLHVMTSTVGLEATNGEIKRDLFFQIDRVVKDWRHSVLDYLSCALDAGLDVRSSLEPDIMQYLRGQYDEWWSVDVKYYSKSDVFSGYIGRYLRRLPLAQSRLRPSDPSHVRFSVFDKRLKRYVIECKSTAEFIQLLADQVQAPYRHAVRYFGLLAPRRSLEYELYWTLLGQQRPTRPRRLTYAECLELIPADRRRMGQ